MRGVVVKIAIAGASGFIGKNLIKSLQCDYKIKALSRSYKTGDKNIKWVRTDLFSYQSINRSLENADIAIYLVHSMLPSSRLFQGNFQDTDLHLADNFARACVNNNVKQIIYLGGLVPEKGMSKHLDSRKEVEEVFTASGIPTTIFRAGMVVGDGGSSFSILQNLVFNLPMMLLPKWTRSITQAIYIDDLVTVIKKSINNTSFFHKTLDTVNGEKITYKELILQTASYFNKKRMMLSVNINSTGFSKLWVTIFGGANYELVSPLIDSLKCDLPNSEIPELIEDSIKHRTYKSMLAKVSSQKAKKIRTKQAREIKNVRSIQRLPNPRQLTQTQIADEYISWLPRVLKFFLKAKRSENYVYFSLIGIKKPLLMLKRINDNSELEREKFHIVGGLLCAKIDKGWLEFRLVAGGKYTLVSINEFYPSLPWYIYKFTQAPVHGVVMYAFGKHLQSLSR